jgi:TolB-like protein/Tfp pilus assembly protein PilF
MAARREFAIGAGLAVTAGALLLLAALLAIRWERAADPTGEITRASRIAVLPFASFSANGNEAYLADGFQEDILTMLAGRGLEVISRTSTTRYAPPDSTASIAEIAAALDVSHVLEGSVRREGDALRIVVQLIEAPADRHPWAATYDRPMADMFAIQSEVSDAVADRLMATLEAAAPAEPAPTRDMDAYDQVLKARALLRSNTFANMKAAEALLEAPRRSDPQLAVAHATLADTLLQQSLSGAEWPALRNRALAASDAALTLDPDSAYAHRVRAHIDSVWQADLPSARAHYREAFRLAPDDPALLADFGAWLLIAEAEPERAVPLLRRALELDPLSPTVQYALVRALADKDRRAEAAAIVQRGLRFNPGNSALLDAQAALRFADGDLFDALEAQLNLVAIDPERAELIRDLANLLAVIGADDAATRWIERLEALLPMHLFTFTARRTLLATQNDGDGLARLANRWDAMNSARRFITTAAASSSVPARARSPGP